ncbi:unnamed protein product [Protopolystoma xenopodis]|uniref:Uncharacterized protein n=1 Tax=Protopolystoma xenopodis TaxID=117903 RepID=A0A3S5B5X1_9PLAT|nr:unnamed protein product [Protopolystoma xenopodis]
MSSSRHPHTVQLTAKPIIAMATGALSAEAVYLALRAIYRRTRSGYDLYKVSMRKPVRRDCRLSLTGWINSVGRLDPFISAKTEIVQLHISSIVSQIVSLTQPMHNEPIPGIFRYILAKMANFPDGCDHPSFW